MITVSSHYSPQWRLHRGRGNFQYFHTRIFAAYFWAGKYELYNCDLAWEFFVGFFWEKITVSQALFCLPLQSFLLVYFEAHELLISPQWVVDTPTEFWFRLRYGSEYGFALKKPDITISACLSLITGPCASCKMFFRFEFASNCISCDANTVLWTHLMTKNVPGSRRKGLEKLQEHRDMGR